LGRPAKFVQTAHQLVYGYLGAPFYFNDYVAASRVTEIGQEIVKDIAAELEKQGARVIEIDTDGVYFQPPAGVSGPDAEEKFVARVGKSLPEGIRLAFDGRYAVMLSLKAKNYVWSRTRAKRPSKAHRCAPAPTSASAAASSPRPWTCCSPTTNPA
jgi:hypothetical protein